MLFYYRYSEQGKQLLKQKQQAIVALKKRADIGDRIKSRKKCF